MYIESRWYEKETYVIPIHGTGLPETDWWTIGSDFYIHAAQNNIYWSIDTEMEEKYEGYKWSGDVDGIFKHTDWKAGGRAFKSYAKHLPIIKRNLIIHSHGLQPIAYSGLKLNNIITIGSPIRNDMMEQYKLLVENSNAWMHIYDGKWDKFGFLGQLFDGKWFGGRNCPVPGVTNCPVVKIDHSRILRDKDQFDKWVTQGWFAFLKQKRTKP